MRLEKGLEVLEVKVNSMGRESLIYPVLIYNEEEAMLVDTGYPGQADNIINAINNSESSFDKVNKIIITHQDIDHIGGLNELIKKSNNEITVFAYKEEAKYITGEETPHKLAMMKSYGENIPEQMKPLYNLLKSGFAVAHSKVDKILEDKEVIDFNGKIEVVHTPGHTKGHIGLYLRESKIFIGADLLFVNEEGKLTLARPDINFDNEAMKKSVEILQKYDIKKVITYHNGVFDKDVNEEIKNL